MLLLKKAAEDSVGEVLSGDEYAEFVAPSLTIDEMGFLIRVEKASERRGGGSVARSLFSKRLIALSDSKFKLTPEGQSVISVLHRLRQGWE